MSQAIVTTNAQNITAMNNIWIKFVLKPAPQVESRVSMASMYCSGVH